MRREAAGATAGILALTLAACGAPPEPEVGSTGLYSAGGNDNAPQHSAKELHMLELGRSIDGMWGITTPDETWLSIQSQNCSVARELGSAEPTAVSWYIPTETPTSTLLDEDDLVGASAAASLVTGCFEVIDSSWQWPSFWGFIRAQANVDSGGGTGVRCEDGTWSTSGGQQGACSWHGGVDD